MGYVFAAIAFVVIAFVFWDSFARKRRGWSLLLGLLAALAAVIGGLAQADGNSPVAIAGFVATVVLFGAANVVKGRPTA